MNYTKFILTRLFPILLVFYACQDAKQATLQDKVERNNPKATADTNPDYQKKTKHKQSNIRKVFEEIPNEMLVSSLFPAPDKEMRKKILSGNAEGMSAYRDVLVDTANHYLFYDKQQGDKGILTTIKTLPYQNTDAELVLIEISLWSKSRVESEALYLLKRNSVGGVEELSNADLLPTVRLQDFYKEDIANKIKEVDHNYMPILCYELPREGDRIKVFLGEWFHAKESFSYKPDIEYIELSWKNSRFEKAGVITGLK